MIKSYNEQPETIRFNDSREVTKCAFLYEKQIGETYYEEGKLLISYIEEIAKSYFATLDHEPNLQDVVNVMSYLKEQIKDLEYLSEKEKQYPSTSKNKNTSYIKLFLALGKINANFLYFAPKETFTYSVQFAAKSSQEETEKLFHYLRSNNKLHSNFLNKHTLFKKLNDNTPSDQVSSSIILPTAEVKKHLPTECEKIQNLYIEKVCDYHQKRAHIYADMSDTLSQNIIGFILNHISDNSLTETEIMSRVDQLDIPLKKLYNASPKYYTILKGNIKELLNEKGANIWNSIEKRLNSQEVDYVYERHI